MTKRYAEMTRSEINEIINRGGKELKDLNRIVADYLDGLQLSEDAKLMIADTDFNAMAECFGGLFTAAEVESFVNC